MHSLSEYPGALLIPKNTLVYHLFFVSLLGSEAFNEQIPLFPLRTGPVKSLKMVVGKSIYLWSARNQIAKKVGNAKKITNVAHIYVLNWFRGRMIVKDKANHAICGKCCTYVIENNQHGMKKNDGQNKGENVLECGWKNSTSAASFMLAQRGLEIWGGFKGMSQRQSCQLKMLFMSIAQGRMITY